MKLIPYINNIGSQKDTVNIDFSQHYTKMILMGDATFVFSNLPLNNKGISIILDLTQDNVGKHIVVWPASVIATPFINSTPNSRIVVICSTVDGGKNISCVSYTKKWWQFWK